MMYAEPMQRRQTTLLPMAVLSFAAALLLSAMAAHALIPHEHQHFAFGEGIAAALHGEERKPWFATLLAGLVPTGLLLAAFRPFGKPAFAGAMPDGVRHHLHEAFQRGILHAKLCGWRSGFDL